MHPKVFVFFACNFHITFPRPITTRKSFTGACWVGFLAKFYPLETEKIRFKNAIILYVMGNFRIC